jgi:outer membrane autotransporter protein
LFSTPIPLVIVSGGANSNAFQLASANTTNPIGLVSYSIVQNGNEFELVSKTAPTATSSAASVGEAVSSAATGCFQGSSAFLGAPQGAEPNRIDGGVWLRAADGMNTVDSTAQITVGSQQSDASLRTAALFACPQVGSDLGAFNV